MESLERFSTDELQDQIAVCEKELDEVRNTTQHPGDIAALEAELHVARRELKRKMQQK